MAPTPADTIDRHNKVKKQSVLHNDRVDQDSASHNDKLEVAIEKDHVENITYDDAEHEPQLHLKTWIALGAMFLFNYVTMFALFGPPAVLSYISASLEASDQQTWILNAVTLPQAVLTPLLASISDVFQVRKPLMLGTICISFIGAAVAPGWQTISRLIGAQLMISFGMSAVALGYAIPSEILPRRWRPMGQVWINIAASSGACSSPLIIGALTKSNPSAGWRNFWWIQMALWGASAIDIFTCYLPPKRHTRLDHLSLLQKLGRLDLPGFGLFVVGLTLFLVGLSLGGVQYSWTNARVLSTLVVGIILLLIFGLYEWKGTSTGVLHHDLFRGDDRKGRTFAICVWLIFVEGVLLFSYVVFYPIMTTVLFTQDPFLLAARQEPYWVCCLIATPVWGTLSTRFRAIRAPIALAFLVFTSGNAGLATIQPDNNLNTLVFAGLAGVGFGGIIVNIVAGVQLCTPHSLIATASAITVSSRAVAASIFTAVYVAAFSDRLTQRLPSYVGEAAVAAGLSPASVKELIGALVDNNTDALSNIRGLSPSILAAALTAFKQAYADSFRIVFIIAAPFGITAVLSCFFMADLTATMDYVVDAPLEDLKSPVPHREENQA